MTFFELAIIVVLSMTAITVILSFVIFMTKKFKKKMQDNNKKNNIQATKHESSMGDRMLYTLREQHNYGTGITPPKSPNPNPKSNVASFSPPPRRSEQSRNQLMQQTMLQSAVLRNMSLDHSYAGNSSPDRYDSSPSHSNHNNCSSGGSSYDSSSSSGYDSSSSSSSSSDSGSSSGGCD